MTSKRLPTGREDDPTGGRQLSRRLLRWLPVAAALGALVGVVWGLFTGEWAGVIAFAGLAAALVGGVLAAIDDGRVQRRVDRITGNRDPGRRRL